MPRMFEAHLFKDAGYITLNIAREAATLHPIIGGNPGRQAEIWDSNLEIVPQPLEAPLEAKKANLRLHLRLSLKFFQPGPGCCMQYLRLRPGPRSPPFEAPFRARLLHGRPLGRGRRPPLEANLVAWARKQDAKLKEMLEALRAMNSTTYKAHCQQRNARNE